MINLTARILGLGALAGMRTMSAPAVLVTYLRRRGAERLDGSPLQLLASPAAAWVTRLLAAGELAADKVPGNPARTEPAPLLARAFSGGLAGYALSAAHGASKGKGVALGAAAAVASAFAAYHARRVLVESSGLPDPVVAVAEDALVIAGGRRMADV
ncbi:MAG: DUF4126 family protein [Candidatus Promineifilaceae bacterium]|nr:DUF4126 family protein [Candidatus Promineifilaceae bacterium]